MEAFWEEQVMLPWKAGSWYPDEWKVCYYVSIHCFCSLQEPLEMKFPNISYSALALMKVRKLQLVG